MNKGTPTHENKCKLIINEMGPQSLESAGAHLKLTLAGIYKSIKCNDRSK